MSNAFARVTRKSPCARCGHPTWCLSSRDGAAVMCMRDLVGFDGETRELADGTPYGYHWTGAPRDAAAPVPPSRSGAPLASPETRDRAYRALLAALSLAPEHEQALRTRGFSPEQARGYRSLRDDASRSEAARIALRALSGEEPSTIPGFARGRDAWRIVGRPGLLIPVRDSAGRVVALKVRPDDPGPDGGKYVWISSAAHDGASPGALAHVARLSPGAPLRVVEGVLKADVAAALDDTGSVIGIPSCTAISTVLPHLTALAPSRVLLAWDSDARTNPHVARGLERALEVMREALPGVPVAVETWERAHKGVDDALKAGATITAHDAPDALVRELVRAADEAEAKRKAAKAPATASASANPGNSATPHRALSDLGNAERIADGYRDRLRWVDGLEWLVWDGKRWKRDTSYEAQRVAVAAIRSIHTEASTHPEGEKAIIKHALRSESANAIGNALKLLRGIPGMSHPIGDFDRDPWLLNCENGTLDLRTGVIRAHQPGDLITKLAPVAWDPGAEADEFETFLARVQPDPGVRAYLQRLAGYAATGVIREHVFPIWYGSGRNGKGTLTDAVRAALGDYATDIPAEMLTVRKNDAHPTERMCLLGARFASASETESNTSLAVAFVKRATGGDPITARLMGKDFVTFEPTHKIVLSTNNRPRISEGSDAIWKRVHLVPWEVQIPEGEVDAGLRDRLREDHRAAVLRWIVDGCRAWQVTGLAAPEKVVAATRAYREDSEPDVQAFLRERCVMEPESRIARKELLVALNAWLAEDGAEPASAKYLGDYIAENAAALRITRTTYGPVKVFRGVRLKSKAELGADAAEASTRLEPDHRAQETSGSSIGLKTQPAGNTSGFTTYEPDEPDTYTHPVCSAHAPPRAPARMGTTDLKTSGSSGSSATSTRQGHNIFMSPIESADRAHSSPDLDDGNGHLWTSETV